MIYRRIAFIIALIPSFILLSLESSGQSVIKGEVSDGYTGEPLIGANVLIKGTSEGNVTDWDGTFVLETDQSFPLTLVFSYLGYVEQQIELTTPSTDIKVSMEEESVTIDVVEVKGQRISDKQKSSPLTVEALDLIAIKETPAASFYEGLGSLKDVDLTTASLGFTIINTRGFNSTNPVRTLQIIDGVDNQSPGLNFSLGNFLGSSELDVNRVELIVGASSAFYGPNAFNGVISMETKNPFYHKGLAGSVKVGERNLLETAFRYADVVNNKEGLPVMAYKFNFSYLTANDWEADNYDPVYESETDENNPGGYDAVNIYGDEFSRSATNPGIGTYHRNGYREVDLVDYGTYNIKASAAMHFRLQPEKEFESSEVILASNFGGGTTVYQGDNRFSLRNIRFYQHRLEWRKKDKFFFRLYGTHEDAGDSYDPYFTALQILERGKPNEQWNRDYLSNWAINVEPRIRGLEGFPSIRDFPGDPEGYRMAINSFLSMFQDSLTIWHGESRAFANNPNIASGDPGFYEVGSPEFQRAFDDITGRIANSEGGTKFFDRSALIHSHGEYIFDDLYTGDVLNDLDVTVGANARYYLPNSQGSILLDTAGTNIDTYEWGVYGGGTMAFVENTLKVNFSARLDKHENFDYLVSPAASVVYNPSPNNFLRVSFSSALRNPTLTDQYLNYNVGPAILRGNIDGVEDLITLESFGDFLNTGNVDTFDFFDVAPIRPEQVRTIEFGYRTTLWDALYVDAGYYFSRYTDFIGFNLGIDAFVPQGSTIPTEVQAFRVSANAEDVVTTQGFSLGLSYYFGTYYQIKGNYSWNVLNTQSDDPIIPAFNTPEHKYNASFSARDLPIGGVKDLGFNINYKWIEGFLFEGSPQFTGFIPTYSLVDAQVNWRWKKMHTTFKLGASNILNTMNFQTYGGPRIGRMAYFSVVYDWKKK